MAMKRVLLVKPIVHAVACLGAVGVGAASSISDRGAMTLCSVNAKGGQRVLWGGRGAEM